MASSKQRHSIYDPYRNIWVQATAEEIVRQKLLHVMTHQLGYPKQFILVEKELSEMPHLMQETLPSRRADILCFRQVEGKCMPLLLIECKEAIPKEEAKRQLLGYNHFVKAPFAALAGPKYVALVYPYSVPFLPSYRELMEASCS